MQRHTDWEGAVISAVAARLDQLSGIVTTIIENGPDAAPGGPLVDVTSASYNNLNGDLSITVQSNIDVKVGDLVNVEGLLFACDRSTGISTVLYNNTTGTLVVTTTEPHQFAENDKVRLEELLFKCNQGTKTYPRGTPEAFSINQLMS